MTNLQLRIAQHYQQNSRYIATLNSLWMPRDLSTTDAVSAHQHLYIINYLRNEAWNSATLYLHYFHKKSRWHRVRIRRTCRNSRRETRQRIPSSGWQILLSASTQFSRNILGSIGTKQIHDSTQPNTSGDSQETSMLPQRVQERHSTLVRSGLQRRTLARHNVWICRRILCRYNPSSTFISRIRLLAQRSCYLLARE